MRDHASVTSCSSKINTWPREGIAKRKEGKLASEVFASAKTHCQARKPTVSTISLELGASYGEWGFGRYGPSRGH